MIGFLCVKIILLLCFICLLLGLAYGVPAGVVAIAIVICFLLGFLNFYHLKKYNYLPKILKYVSGIIIVAIVVTLAVIGFVKDIISDFSVVTIIAAIIIIGFFIVYLIIAFNKSSNQYNHPHVYSAYGLTIYRFES